MQEFTHDWVISGPRLEHVPVVSAKILQPLMSSLCSCQLNKWFANNHNLVQFLCYVAPQLPTESGFMMTNQGKVRARDMPRDRVRHGVRQVGMTDEEQPDY